MKGLLMKDFGLISSNRRMLFIFAAIAVLSIIAGNGENASFGVMFLITFCGTQVISTISYDEFDHSSTYLMTLPISRKQYAAEKYLFLWLMMGIGFAASVVVSLLVSVVCGVNGNILEWIVGCVAALLVIYLLLMVLLPLQLKFGGENGRMIIMAFVAVFLIITFAAKGISSAMNINVEAGFNRLFLGILALNKGMLVLLILAVVVIATAVSLLFSIRIIQKRQF
ncbi:MAG: ABC-2 transporter permease [Hespellia sp.]|nr:ABC-2 transporter permease [Hespellia sp.]